jgi:hypothetical protein
MRKAMERCSSKKAQASLEYFIIFALIGGLTILAATSFLDGTRDTAFIALILERTLAT